MVQTEDVVLLGISASFCTLTLIQNFLQCFTSRRNRRSTGPVQALYTSLLCADTMYSICLPLLITTKLAASVRIVVLILVMGCSTSSLTSLMCSALLAADKTISLACPFYYSTIVTESNILKTSILIWILSLGASSTAMISSDSCHSSNVSNLANTEALSHWTTKMSSTTDNPQRETTDNPLQAVSLGDYQEPPGASIILMSPVQVIIQFVLLVLAVGCHIYVYRIAHRHVRTIRLTHRSNHASIQRLNSTIARRESCPNPEYSPTNRDLPSAQLLLHTYHKPYTATTTATTTHLIVSANFNTTSLEPNKKSSLSRGRSLPASPEKEDRAQTATLLDRAQTATLLDRAQTATVLLSPQNSTNFRNQRDFEKKKNNLSSCSYKEHQIPHSLPVPRSSSFLSPRNLVDID